ncbi:MAG TPA: polysaccharide deacetylase family protein [Clostridiaceae bacterium]
MGRLKEGLNIAMISKNLLRKVTGAAAVIIVCLLMTILFNSRNLGVFLKANGFPIYSVETNEKKIALTFDVSVGGEDNTEELLTTLKKYKVKATFFILGLYADKYSERVIDIYKGGNEIGNHSDTHPIMTEASTDRITQEVNITDNKLEKLTGAKIDLFRFPSGAYDGNAIRAVEATGHFCIQWNVDSIDWKEQGEQKELDRILKNAKAGSILLFHNNAKYTPANIPKVIEELSKRGFSFVTVSNLIYKKDYHINLSGVQING